jgi:hypothetical protein
MRPYLQFYFGFVSACLLLLVSAKPAQAQCGVNTIGFGDVGVIAGNAFHAEIVITTSGSHDLRRTIAQRQPRLVARDSQGRVRSETVAGEYKRDTGAEAGTNSEEHLIRICDTTAQTLTQIDTLNATAKIIHSRPSAPISSTIPRRSFCSTRLPSSRVAHAQVEDLGDQNIEGVAAHGVRMRTLPQDPGATGGLTPRESLTDRWCSDDLAAIVLTVFEDTKTGVKTSIAMRNIERTEPDPTLFQIPPDYAVTESIEEPHELHNPHAQPIDRP